MRILHLQVVESEIFVRLNTILNPTRTSMSRHKLGRGIVTRHKQMIDHLIWLGPGCLILLPCS
jgi:hypothetical protein